VPDPSNVLDYNRYMYGLGNPVSNNDPSGHFSENAIRNHLASAYGVERVDNYYAQLQENEQLYNILLAATGGDVLISTSDTINYTRFEGSGHDVLTGISSLSGSIWGEAQQSEGLMGLANGASGTPAVLAQFDSQHKLREVIPYNNTLENKGGTVTFGQEWTLRVTLGVMMGYVVDYVVPGGSQIAKFANKTTGSVFGTTFSFADWGGYVSGDERLRLNLITDQHNITLTQVYRNGELMINDQVYVPDFGLTISP